MKLGELFYTVSLDKSNFEIGVKNVIKQGNGLAEILSSGIKKVAGVLAGAAIVKKATDGITALAKMGVSYNAQMEDYTTNFRVMLDSQEAAIAKVEELKKMAAQTPFAMDDLASGTQTLLAFGIEADKTTEILKMIGDVSLGNKNKMSSLTLAFSQMSSTGKLMGQDLMQMVNAGFNPLQVIAEKTGTSIGDLKDKMGGGKGSDKFRKMIKDAQEEVKKLGDNASEGAKMLAQIGTDGEISADLVVKAFELATSEGGQFFNGMSEASKTLNGRLSTLNDNFGSLVGEIFEPTFQWISDNVIPYAIDAVDNLSQGFKEGGVVGMLSAAGAIISELGENLKKKAEELLPAAANSVIDVINTTFGLNIPHIDSIKLPTWEEINQTISNWWNGSEDSPGGIAGLISGVTQWALGALSEFPDLKTIITDISTWWAETAWPGLQSIFSWALVGDPTTPPLEALKTFVTTWWKINAWPMLQGIFKWAFGVEVPDWETVVTDIKTMWDNVKRGISGLFKETFGIELPSISEIAAKIRRWWESVKSSIGSLFVNADVKVGVRTSNTGEEHGGEVGGRFATGLDYVPYDDYAARLHEGEAVLTKLEAQNWRKGQGNMPVGENITVTVHMDNVSVRDERDIKEIAKEIAALTRRKNYGVGAVSY